MTARVLKVHKITTHRYVLEIDKAGNKSNNEIIAEYDNRIEEWYVKLMGSTWLTLSEAQALHDILKQLNKEGNK